MKLLRSAALAASLLLLASPLRATEQSSYVMPTTGPMSMSTFVGTYLNPGLRAVAGCHNGSSAPANGPSSSPEAWQCWVDTSSNPALYKIYDGSSWVTLGDANTTSHAWSPYINGAAASSDTGTGAIVRATGPTISAPTISGHPTVEGVTSTGATGTGVFVFGTSPALTTPDLGTPSAVNLSNATGLPVGSGISGLGTGVATWLATPSSANLASAVTDETGSGSLMFGTSPTVSGHPTVEGVTSTGATGTGAFVFGTSPTLTTPDIGVATATTVNKVAITAPATGSTLTIPDGVTLTGPAASGTAMTLGNAETVTGAKSFDDGTLKLNGATSGSTILGASAAASGTLTLPAATDTLVGKATTDTLTNKTFDTAGTGNSFSINGLAATANTGTGSVVRATSPTISAPTISGHATIEGVTPTGATGTGALVFGGSPALTTPDLGTPSAATLTNATGLPISTGVSGLGTGVATLLATPSSANLASALTDETGSGVAVFGTAPTISAPTLSGLVDRSGASKDSTQSTPAQITADQNDYNPSSVVCATSSTLILDEDAAHNVTGVAGGVAGCDLYLFNSGSFALTLKDESTSSTAANRFAFGADFSLASKAAAHLKYDGGSSRWRNLTGSGSGGGGSGTVTSITAGGGLSGGTITTSGTLATMNVVNIAARAGSLDVWQRGAGGSASIAVVAAATSYTADGWYLTTTTGQSSTVSAQTGIATGSYKAAKIARDSGQTGTGTMRFAMPLDIDEVAKIAGNYVTLSFTAKAGANWSPTSGTLSYTLYCGTTATAAKRNVSAYTGETTPISSSANITTTATRYEATSSSAVGATCAQAEIQFSWAPTGTAGADDSFTLDDVQLEVVSGSSSPASPFVATSFADQLAMCQRFYWKSYSYGTAPGSSLGASPGSQKLFWSMPASGTTQWAFPFTLPTRMRTTPTLTIYDSAGNANKIDAYAAGWTSNNSVAGSSTTDMTFYVQESPTSISGMAFNVTEDASI